MCAYMCVCVCVYSMCDEDGDVCKFVCMAVDLALCRLAVLEGGI